MVFNSAVPTVLTGWGGSPLAAASLPDLATATNYATEINSMRTGDDMTAGSITSLSNFIRSLQGEATTEFPYAVDVWDNVRVLAFCDGVFGVGEGTVIQPVIADDGSGNPVGADDANQENGTMVGGAHWDSFQTSSQYAQLPFPSASFDYSEYSLCALYDTGATSGLGTVIGIDANSEGTSTANTSSIRLFANERFDGWGASNIFGQLVNTSYMLQRASIIREDLTGGRYLRNGLVRNLNRTTASASTPDYINIGHFAGLPGYVKSYGCVLLDSAITNAQATTITKNLDILRTSQDSGGVLKLTHAGSDELLIEASTTNKLLIEAA